MHTRFSFFALLLGLMGLFVPSASFADPSAPVTTADVRMQDCSDVVEQVAELRCKSFTWYDVEYTESGTYEHVVSGVVDGVCDSIYQLRLTIALPSIDTLVRKGCNSLTYNDVAYTRDTFFVEALGLNTYGCDSLRYVDIRIGNTPAMKFDTIVGCNRVVFRRTTYLADHEPPTASSLDEFGCNVLTRTFIKVNYSSTSTVDTAVCDSLVWGGQSFYESVEGQPVVIENHVGCDSIITMNLTVSYSPAVDTAATPCDSMVWYGVTYRESGIYAHVVEERPDGCDSILRLTLTIRVSTSMDTLYDACDSLMWDGAMRYESGVFPMKLSIANAAGCDSMLNLILTVNHASAGDTSANVCDSLVWYGNHLTANGRTTTTLVNHLGCDSLLTLSLVLRHGTRSHEYADACGYSLWRGFRIEEDGDFNDTMQNSAGCDSIITLHLTLNPLGVGALNGVFKVGEERYINFSMGNLQYMPSNDLWRFAARQFDHVGYSNSLAASDYRGWIDLFGWATSGYHSPSDDYNVFYEPYSIISQNVSNDNAHGYGPSVSFVSPDLTGASSNYDWGIFNAVSNGGEAPGQWRTLSDDEWSYLLFYRDNAVSKRAMATVSGVQGVVLLPESWILPDGCSYTAGNNDGYITNVYTSMQWTSMEEAGAVFLPSAGVRYDTNVTAVSQNGFYWTTTHYDQNRSYAMLIESRRVSTEPFDRSVGRSVRLVQDINGVSLPCDTYGDTTVVAIDSTSWLGDTYYQSGDYTHRLSNANSVGCDSTAVLHLTIRSALGVKSPSTEQMRCYAAGRNVVVEGAQGRSLHVYDVTGRVVASDANVPNNRKSYAVPSKGVYMVKVGQSGVRRVVVSK